MADNAGSTEEHRALNYLAVRYRAIYAKAAEEFGRNSSLTAVEVRTSLWRPPAGSSRWSSPSPDARPTSPRSFVRVDVTEMFPFLVTKLSPCYDH